NLADTDLDFILFRLEFPRQARRYVRIKADGERAAENSIGGLFRDLRGAAEAGRLAEPAVQRHGCIGSADHADDERSAASRHQTIATWRFLAGLLRGLHHRSRPFSCQIGRIRTPGPFTSVMT